MLFDDLGRRVAEHPGVRTVPRDRRVPQANRGACVLYAPTPRSPLRPFDGQSPRRRLPADPLPHAGAALDT